MSWRDRLAHRRAREEVEAKRYAESEGVGLNWFVRILVAPVAVVVVLVATRGVWSTPVLVALGAVALLLLLGLAKALWKRGGRTMDS